MAGPNLSETRVVSRYYRLCERQQRDKLTVITDRFENVGDRSRVCCYLCMVNSKLLPALTITSCASLCLRLYISVLLTLITASPAFKPAASAGDPVLTCNARRLLNKRIISCFSLRMVIRTNQSFDTRPFSWDTQTLSSAEKSFGRLRAAIFKCTRYTSNVGYCASIHARTFEKRRFR